MMFLPGLERNLRMIVDWFLDLVFRNDIAVLSAERKTRLNRAFYHIDDVIVREGEVGDCAFLIRSGQVVIQKKGCRVAILGPGECFGEIALLTNSPRTATVVATTPLELTILRRDTLLELTAGFRPLRDALKRQIKVRVNQLQEVTHQG
jgi:CRP-like cAMP-binding protein